MERAYPVCLAPIDANRTENTCSDACAELLAEADRAVSALALASR